LCRFVQKVYTLDPTTDAIPWNSRGYSRKRKPLTDHHVVEDAKRVLVEETAETGKCGHKKKQEVIGGRYTNHFQAAIVVGSSVASIHTSVDISALV